MNRSAWERCSTALGGTPLRWGPLTALLSRASLFMYTEKASASPPAGRTVRPLTGRRPVSSSVPVSSRQVTAAAAARGPAELEESLGPPAGFHILTLWTISQLFADIKSWKSMFPVHDIMQSLIIASVDNLPLRTSSCVQRSYER